MFNQLTKKYGLMCIYFLHDLHKHYVDKCKINNYLVPNHAKNCQNTFHRYNF